MCYTLNKDNQNLPIPNSVTHLVVSNFKDFTVVPKTVKHLAVYNCAKFKDAPKNIVDLFVYDCPSYNANINM